jgi:hypothetical protein
MARPARAAALSERKVFAHYMVAWPRGGRDARIADYVAEFRDAQRRGIDGFALNCGGWSLSEPLYRSRILTMYRAAEELGDGFRLFVSADGKAQQELDQIVRTTAELPAQLMVDGKPVLSSYALGGQDAARCEVLIAQADKLGAYFVPHFMPSTREAEIGDVAALEVASRCQSASGYFYFGAAGLPDSLARSTRNLAEALKSSGKLFMASVTPYYRGLASGTNYRAFETNGFSGMETEWRAAIEARVDWIQIVTWNDWAESTYVSPIGSSTRKQVYDPRFGALLNHTAYLDASRYFIEWFKRGDAPEIERDVFYYFYRVHPIRTGLMKGEPTSSDTPPPPLVRAPLTAQIHVTAFLTEAAVLVIEQGGTHTTHKLCAGVNHVAVPASPGAPRFVLVRNGNTIADKKGEESIRTDDYSGAFNYFSGSSALVREEN